ncbi:MAG: hypothetical protein KDD69_19700, partial [Bdellovibrionales bacterium]|nr:hypothetical protein [Bdellovibrionales bacterium]
MDRAYRAQCLFEAARQVRDGVSEEVALDKVMQWLPALVRHYHRSIDADLVAVYATAWDHCIQTDAD